eukprot:5973779-Pyramimonas_sp.AAC.1
MHRDGSERPQDAMGGHGRPQKATGGHGRQREATGSYMRPREATGGDAVRPIPHLAVHLLVPWTI